MQSGITASEELHVAFQGLTSASPAQRALIVGIKQERLVPLEVIGSTTDDFFDDVASIGALLKDDEAAYVLLRRYDNVPDGYVAVTYVPDTANVRQKMLFASTRLTLVRELSKERFRETLFVTTKQELTADGWYKRDEHGEIKAPLTNEEQTLQGVRDAEAEASTGTSSKGSHVSSGLSFPVSENVLQALRTLASSKDNLIQLKIDGNTESIELASVSSTEAKDLAYRISDCEPRYSFFRYPHDHEGQSQSPILFIYTCPSASKIKERMIYASSRSSIISTATTEAGLEISKKLEASMPSEVTASVIHEEFHPRAEQKQGFSKPKRPGRR